MTKSKRTAESRRGFGAPEGSVAQSLRQWLHRPRLLLITDILLIVLLVIFPFVMGGREAWGHRLLVTLAFALGGFWCLHRSAEGGRVRFLALEPLLIAGLLLVWFQTRELQPEVLNRLSAEYQRLIPVWGDLSASETGSSQAWSTASFAPAETRHAFLILLAYGIIGIVLSQRIASEQDCHRILKLVAVSGMLMAGFAVLQLITSNDCFFWFYRHPYTGTRETLKGAFTNRNHFAQFLALSVAPLLWWALAARKRRETAEVMNRKGLGPAQGNHSKIDSLVDPQLLLLISGTAGVLISVMLSLSRGGMIAAGVACSVVFAGLWKSGKVASSLALTMVLLGVLALGGIVMFGEQQVETRVSQLASLDADRIDQMNARRAIWKADLKAIQEFPLLGTGVGSHRFVYPIYMEDLAEFTSFTFSHAECSYIHLALEAGLVGLALLLLGLLFVTGRFVHYLLKGPDASRMAALAAVMAAVAGGMCHAAADFIWYVPAVVVTTLALIVTGLRLVAGFNPDAGLPVPRAAWLTAGLGCFALLVLVQPDLGRRVAGERYWFRYLTTAFDARTEQSAETAGLLDSEPRQSAEDQFEDIGRDDEQPSFALGNSGSTGNASSAPPDTEPKKTPETAVPGETARYLTDELGNENDPVQKRMESLQTQIALLLRAYRERNDHPEISLHLARRSLELFELQQTKSDNPLPLVQIRDAVIASGFDSSAALHEFLDRAFGSPIRLVRLADTMCRQTLRHCPLQADAWKLLISTNFIRDPQDRLQTRLMAQTMRLGRYNPSIRFAVGQALFLSGRSREALAQWNAVFHSTKAMRLQMCRVLGSKFSVESVLTSFQPNLEELEDVFTVYSTWNRRSDMERLMYVVLEKTAFLDEHADAEQETQDFEKHLSVLMQANRVADSLGLNEHSQTLLTRAITCDSAAEAPRRALGLLMLKLEQYDDAERLFAWCYDQMPGDVKLEELRRECRRLRNQKSRRLRTVSSEKQP